MQSPKFSHIDAKGYIQTIHILEYYQPIEKRIDFVFDKCYSKNENTGLWEKRPRNPHNEDIVRIYYACQKGDEVVSYKERQIGWTWDITSCIVTDMLMEVPLFTAFWQSIDDEHSCEVIDRAHGMVEHFDFPLPPAYIDFITGAWNIEIPPQPDELLGRDDGKECHFIAFSKRPTHITGKTPNVYVVDEAAKFDPPNLYEKAKREARAAVRSAKYFKNSTTLHGNSFEEEVKLPPIVGPSYDQHLGSFKTPTFEQWLKARDEMATKNLKGYVERTTKKSKGLKAKNK